MTFNLPTRADLVILPLRGVPFAVPSVLIVTPSKLSMLTVGEENVFDVKEAEFPTEPLDGA